MAEKEKSVSVNFKISGHLYSEIFMMFASLKSTGKKLNDDIYPEVMELGIEGFRKKYKI